MSLKGLKWRLGDNARNGRKIYEMAALRLAALIIGITVASGWLLQRVELVYNGPHLAGAGSMPGAQVFLAVPLGALAAVTLNASLAWPGGSRGALRRTDNWGVGDRFRPDASVFAGLW